MVPPGIMEPTVKYHPRDVETLTKPGEAQAGTTAGGQFDWGGRLLKSNGGARRFAQAVWKSAIECKGLSELDGESYKTSRWETRP